VSGRIQAPGFLGGIGLTHLTVYEQRPAPDGVMSGCAHVHAVTDEAYYVLSGTGAVELHDAELGFRSVPLARGSYVQFPPGTLHRTVSTGGLEILAIMGNAGLAERGDARIYFGPAVDADPAEYQRLSGLPGRGLEGALERRDASVRAYLVLLDLWRRDRDAYRAELERFVSLHARSVAARRDEFEALIRAGPARWSELALARLAAPGTAALPESSLSREADTDARLGMCGTLKQYHGLTPI